MKTLLLSLTLGAALALWAVTPSYVSKSGAGNASAGAQVIFPSDASLQIRLVNLNWQSDSNSAVLSYTTGEAAYSITATNPSTSYLTQYVNSTAGMNSNSTLFVLEHLGVGYAALLVSTNSGTNAVFFTGAFGVQSSVGDSLYQMSTASTVLVGATTNAHNGEALFVGNYARPVRVQLTPALATNRITSATARYE